MLLAVHCYVFCLTSRLPPDNFHTIPFFRRLHASPTLSPRRLDLPGVLASGRDAAVRSRQGLAGGIRANVDTSPVLADFALPEMPSGKLNSQKLGAVIANLQPEDCIIAEEGVTAGAPYYALAQTLKPHSHMSLTGGAIGMGMPLALGAALACPEKQVINIEADGSAMYTVQALWSQAHENTNVTTCAHLRLQLSQRYQRRGCRCSSTHCDSENS